MTATTQERFDAFNHDNPHVYDTLRRLALRTRASGHTTLGIGQLWEVMRWEMSLTTTENKPRLNNDWRAFYARLLMEREPLLAGAFHTRRSKADRPPPEPDTGSAWDDLDLYDEMDVAA